MIRQGDCLLIPITEIPEGVKMVKAKEDRYVLLEGEATGHHHSVATENVEMYERNGLLYLKVKKETPLEHQEHAPLLLGRGNYVMLRQREFWDEEIRNVCD